MKRIKVSSLQSVFEEVELISKSHNIKIVPVGDITYIDINDIVPGRFQPRRKFDDKALEELSQSISTSGVLQPILVKKNEDQYEIIAGERRWRASKLAGLPSIPCLIIEFDDSSCMAFSLLENIQRESLTPIEEANAYKRLLEEFEYTQKEVSAKVGKSREYISNSIRLTNLPEVIQNALEENKITVGHAKVIISCSFELQLECLSQIINNKLSVRQIEQYVKHRSLKTATPNVIEKKYVIPKKEQEDLLDFIAYMLNCKAKLKLNDTKTIIQLEFESFFKAKKEINLLYKKMAIENEALLE